MARSATSPPATSQGPRRSSSLTATGITGVAVVALGIVLIAEHTAEARIRPIVPVVERPLWTALAILVAGGILAGWLLCRRRMEAAARGNRAS